MTTAFDENTANELLELVLKAKFNDASDQKKLTDGIKALEQARKDAGPAALKKKELESQSWH